MVAIPAVPILPNQYLKRARILSSRQDLLRHLPKEAVFCEVGVAYGDFSADVLGVCRPRKFIAIDNFELEHTPSMWGFERLQGRPHEEFYRKRFVKELISGRMELLRGDSQKALPRLPDASVDVFYLDALHSYEAVSGELSIVKRKVTPDGWILLNDYTLYDTVSDTPYGVIHAAHEFMLAEGWEMRFLALQPLMFCDIALTKLKPGPPIRSRPRASSAGGRRQADGARGRGAATGQPPLSTATAATPADPVWLLIWQAEDIGDHRDAVIALARRGIVHSVCSTVADPGAIRQALERAGIGDHLVFVSIETTPKTERIAAIIEAAEMPAASVMLIDDDPGTKAELAALIPALRVAERTIIATLLDDPRFTGGKDCDPTRLAQYKLLERRDAVGRTQAGDDSGLALRVRIDPDVAAHLDRAIELIGGTQQLNFTGRRLPASLAEARRQLLGEIAPHYVSAGLVRVADDACDYGYCGFYQMIGGEAVDFCFSRRILGLGIDGVVYEWLGRPVIAGTAVASIDRLRPADRKRFAIGIGSRPGDRPAAAAAIPEVRLRGGHDVAALAHYFRFAADNVALEASRYRGPLFLQFDSSALMLPALGQAPHGFEKAVVALGYEKADLGSGLFSDAAPGSMIVYSPAADLYLPVYRHKTAGFAVPVTVDIYEDLTRIDDGALGAALGTLAIDATGRQQIRDIVGALRRDYVWEPRLPLEKAVAIARSIFERIPAGARFFFVLPYEWAKWDDRLEPRAEAGTYNAGIRRLAAQFPAVTVLAMDDVVAGRHEMQRGVDQFDRIVYFRLYERIIELAAGTA